MIKDTYFSRRVYEGAWRRNEYFSEYGDTENYWIDLAYYCNRGDYDLLRQSRGTELDFGLLDGDGNKIFADLAPETLSMLSARGYKLLDQTHEAVGEDGDLYRVVETYGYAPETSYVLPDWDMVKILALEDNDFATSTAVVQDSTHATIANDFYKHIVLRVADASAFKTGDTVMVHFNCRFVYKDPNGVAADKWYNDAWVDSDLMEILSIDRELNLIELNNATLHNLEIDYKYFNNNIYVNHKIYNDLEFWWWIGGKEIAKDHNATLWPTSATLVRGYSYREAKNRQRQIRKTVSYHEEEPIPPDVEVPMMEAGGEADKISRCSEPSHIQWKARVAAGGWYVYKTPEVVRDERTGIYKMTVREAPCE